MPGCTFMVGNCIKTADFSTEKRKHKKAVQDVQQLDDLTKK